MEGRCEFPALFLKFSILSIMLQEVSDYKKQEENHFVGNNLADYHSTLLTIQRFMKEVKNVYLDKFDLELLNEYLLIDGKFKKFHPYK
jgi:hypothetical protein